MKIICVGRNYAAHAAELNNPVPQTPLLFLKPDTAQLLDSYPLFYPSFTKDLHYEVEVLLKICKNGKHITPEFASDYYNEVSVGIDFTARDVQNECKKKGHPWEKAKAFDGSAVIGQWVEKEKFKDLHNIDFHLKKNDKIVQSGNTANMIYDIDTLIAYVSQYMTLKIGDILFTGTPAGVGPVAIDDKLTGYLNSEESFTLNIK